MPALQMAQQMYAKFDVPPENLNNEILQTILTWNLNMATQACRDINLEQAVNENKMEANILIN